MMKILMLVNWKVKKCSNVSENLQAPDYITPNKKYWFFRYVQEDVDVDVIDISSVNFWEKIEKNKLHFYIIQTVKAIFRVNKYDMIISHGMPSGIGMALFRKFFKTKAKHIVFDIGSFNSAAEKGKILKINQFASKSIDGIIYHSSQQIEYYRKFYPWLVDKSKFIHFGTDLDYFKRDLNNNSFDNNYILSIGYSMRDIDTLINAYSGINSNIELRIVGNSNIKTTNNKIKILGPVDKRYLNKLIQGAIFCVLPLENKNFSFGQMTLLQQMYYGKAIITSKVPSMIDYVEDKKTAILYEAKNVEDLKVKMELLLNDKTLLENIGQNAKKVVIEKYNEKNMADEIWKFINNL